MSHWLTWPWANPVLNQRTRCAEVPMGERVRHHAALALLLQAVIADGIGGIQGLFDVSRLQPVQAFARMVGPHTRQAIGLQLLAYQQAAIALHLPPLLACFLDFRRHAEQRLHMVSDFVGNDVGLGEVSGGGEALGHFLEETHVQIDLPVCRAIERTGRRRGKAAGRVDPAAEQHQFRLLVLASGLLENLAPGVFGIAKDRAHELGLFIVGRWRLAGL